MTEEHTPDLKHVRRAATDFGTPITPDEFDRWLEAHDREVAERAFDEGVHSTNNSVDTFCACECNPYRKETT